MGINYENTCKLYMHAYLTLDFPNVALHSFSLGHQCFFFFFFDKSTAWKLYSYLYRTWFYFANEGANFSFSLKVKKKATSKLCFSYFFPNQFHQYLSQENIFQIKFVIHILDVFHALLHCIQYLSSSGVLMLRVL